MKVEEEWNKKWIENREKRNNAQAGVSHHFLPLNVRVRNAISTLEIFFLSSFLNGKTFSPYFLPLHEKILRLKIVKRLMVKLIILGYLHLVYSYSSIFNFSFPSRSPSPFVRKSSSLVVLALQVLKSLREFLSGPLNSRRDATREQFILSSFFSLTSYNIHTLFLSLTWVHTPLFEWNYRSDKYLNFLLPPPPLLLHSRNAKGLSNG